MPDDDSNATRGGSHDRGMIPRDELDFLPRVRWRIWAPVIAVIVVMITGYFVSEARKSRRMRAALLSEHAEITRSLSAPYRETRARVERLAFSAVGPWPGNSVAPGFTLTDLRAAPVLYGRVRIGEVKRIEDVSGSIKHRYADQIASCLGIEANLARDFFTRGDFLMPAYVESVRNVQDGDRLRALREDLMFRLNRDWDDLRLWSGRKYFVLAVDEGTSAIDGPTRVFVWDLPSERLMFRTRASGGDSVLVPVRVGTGPSAPARAPEALTLSLHDCSVAAAAAEQLGTPMLSMRNPPAPPAFVAPTAAAGAAGAASDGTDAGVVRSGSTDDAGPAAR